MQPLPYFAYGSNLLLARLRQANRCPSARRVGSARLAGYRLSFAKRSNVDLSGKCTIHRCDESHVFGVLYEIAPEEQQALHLVEGVGYGYELLEVDVERNSGEVIRAFAYQAQKHWLSPELQPMDWYRDLVLAGAIENRLGEALIEQLRRTPTQPDPDSERGERERAALPPGFVEAIRSPS